MAANASRRRACGPSLLLRAIWRRAAASKSFLSGIGMANLPSSPPLNQTRPAAARPKQVNPSETWYQSTRSKSSNQVTKRLVIPANTTLLALPAKAPELNPVENVWQFLRDNWLSNRIFPSYRDILDHCCAAWNKLTDQPWRIISLGLRDWAHVGADQ